MYEKVFISHAREDAKAAQAIYYFLKDLTPFKPWLDKVNILPGHNWREEINLALKSADFIIILFSRISVEKIGYIQKEFKLALDYCEERPEDTIYIIPVLLDECKIPEKFNKYQWIKINEPEAYETIYTSLRQQREKYLQLETERIAQNLSYRFDIRTLEETLGYQITHTLEISYPQFVNTDKLSLKHINTYILGDVYRSHNLFMFNNVADESNGNPYSQSNEFRITYNLELITPKLITLTVYNYQYTGGAHGNYGTSGLNYILDPVIEIDLKMLLDYQQDALLILGEICKYKLLEKGRAEFDIEEENDFFLENFADAVSWEFLGNFYIGKRRTINILFAPYQITAYAYGQHDIEIPFDELYSQIGGLRKLREIDQYLNITPL